MLTRVKGGQLISRTRSASSTQLGPQQGTDGRQGNTRRRTRRSFVRAVPSCLRTSCSAGESAASASRDCVYLSRKASRSAATALNSCSSSGAETVRPRRRVGGPGMSSSGKGPGSFGLFWPFGLLFGAWPFPRLVLGLISSAQCKIWGESGHASAGQYNKDQGGAQCTNCRRYEKSKV